MIINFTMRNWRSFRDEVVFSMLAGKERQHANHVARVGKYGLRMLPVSAIFGGNAFGKSNFIKALQFLKNLVVNPPKHFEDPIPVSPYILDEKRQEPSFFSLQFLAKEKVYCLEISLNAERILEEKLTLTKSSAEYVLYHRQGDHFTLDKKVFRQRKERELLMAVAELTPRNQLFLTEAVHRNRTQFQDIYGWFRDKLQILSTDEALKPEAWLNDPVYMEQMAHLLDHLDTGVVGLASIQERGHRQHGALTLQEQAQSHYPEEKAGPRLMTHHRNAEGVLIPFDLQMESDGTRRLLEVLPYWVNLNQSDCVCLIDEMDRSLHTLLVQALLTQFLEHCSPKNRAQLIFTTHDMQLMTQDILRRDEIWFTKRDQNGVSTLCSYIDFPATRADQSIRRSYLHGRLGAIPKVNPYLMDVEE